MLDLTGAAPVAIEALLFILEAQQAAAIQDGVQLSPSELALPRALAAAGAQLPSGASIYVPWAVRGCSRNSGYIPATAQEALLVCFLGERGSAALAAAPSRPTGLTSVASTATRTKAKGGANAARTGHASRQKRT